MKRIRTFEQLRFIQACIKQKLTTKRVSSSAENLELKNRQLCKLESTITTNIRNNLYKELSQREIQKGNAIKEAYSLLNKREINAYDDAVTKEKSFVLNRTKLHFRECLDKIKNVKNKIKRRTEVEIDGIMMKDIELGGQFESNPRIYGGMAIGKYESQALSLPPRFAVFSKVKPIECKAEFEKAFTKLRWNREFERQRGGNEVKRDIYL